MKKVVGLRRRLTYANVVATLALFFALGGGVAVAAPKFIEVGGPAGGDLTGTYPNPSIGANAVTGAKVLNNGLTGDDITESTLGKVPSAAFADSAGDADTLDGINSTGFLGVTAKAADSELLDRLDSSAFLGANAKAADSDQLDGMDSTQFIQGGGHSVTEFVRVPPGGSRAFDLPGFGTIQFDCRLNDAESRPQVRISFFTSGLRTLAAASVADIDARRPGGGSLGLPDTQVGFSGNPLDLDDAWIAAATITGGSPTVSAFGIAYGQIGECAIQFHAAIG